MLFRSVLTSAEQLSLTDKNKVRVGYGLDYAPIQYTNKSGEAAGICIDLFDMIASKAGLEVEYVPIEKGFSYDASDIDLSRAIVVASSWSCRALEV